VVTVRSVDIDEISIVEIRNLRLTVKSSLSRDQPRHCGVTLRRFEDHLRLYHQEEVDATWRTGVLSNLRL